MGRSQEGTLFVFDEPTIGLHPLDVEVLLRVLQGLVEHGALTGREECEAPWLDYV